MNTKPNIKLQRTATDTVLEIIGWSTLLAVWVLTITHYAALPDALPIHDNVAGEPDNFGERINILALPLIATFLFITLTLLNRHPHWFSYPVVITEENARLHYTIATRLVRFLKLILVVIFGLITLKTIQTTNGLGVWFFLLTLGAIFIPLTYFIVQMGRTKKH